MVSSTLNTNFDQYLINDILVTLSVKSLVRFRSVSSHWRKNITQPEFISTHYKKSTEDPNNLTRWKLLLTTPNHLVQTLDGPQVLKEGVSNDDFRPINPSFAIGRCRLLSCNGLVCVYLYPELLSSGLSSPVIYIWNPTTGIHRKLPKTPNPKQAFCSFGFTFGYDQSSGDYKFVREISPTKRKERGKNSCGCAFEIFSLNSGAWKTIDNVNCKTSRPIMTLTYMNEVIYWAENCENQLEWTIRGFDLKSESFCEVLPTFKSRYIYKMDVWDGCLCAYCPLMDRGFEFWMMKKDCNFKESNWIKLLCVSSPLEMCPRMFSLYPLFKLESTGEVLIYESLMRGENLTVYDLEKRRRRIIYSGSDFSRAVVYTETLASPYGDGTGKDAEDDDKVHHELQQNVKRKSNNEKGSNQSKTSYKKHSKRRRT